MERATLKDADGLHVWAELRADGGLVIQGQDLRSPFGSEYEYALEVAPVDVPRVRRALGGGDDDDVLELLERHGAVIVGTGERNWLTSLGLEPSFWSYVS